MSALEFQDILEDDVEDVVALWKKCGLTRPWNDPHADIEFARKTENAALLVGRLDDQIIANVMVGYDGHRGMVYYLAVDPDHHGKGFGREIMDAAEDWLLAHGVWKLNLMVRTDNTSVIDFYSAIGYDHQDVVTLGKWIDPARKPSK